MTPKEKAIQLIDKFKIGDVVTEKLQIVNINIYSKLFALRAVDEMICALACARTKDDNLTEEEEDILNINIDNRQTYLFKVEKEIKNL